MADRVSVSDTIDLSLCEREPIHSPGAIQPHGALLAAETEGWRVTHASANLMAILGRDAQTVLGRPLAAAIGQPAWSRLLAAWQNAPVGDGIVPGHPEFVSGPCGGVLYLHAYRSGGYLCIDFEPAQPVPKSAMMMAQQILETFRRATSRAELCDLAVRGLRALTGYHRVMAYRFAEDGHGEVIAEDRLAELDPYLGLHYPASDIPPQARRLYLKQRVGVIPDAGYTPVALLADPRRGDGTPLDLTLSTLRSISPVHLQYLRNMRSVATLRITLSHAAAQKPSLWGLLVCHHTTPLVLSRELQAVAAMIGEVMSLLLDSLGKVETYSDRMERRIRMRSLVLGLAANESLGEVLAAAEADLLDLADAGGVVVRLAGTIRCMGCTPPLPVAERALAVMLAGAGEEPLALDDLGLRHGEFADYRSSASGALLLPLARGTDDAILWFRPELTRTITWAGNPADHGPADPVTRQLSPRASFAAWHETVTRRSAPWSEVDILVAHDLRAPIELAMAQRTRADLERLRFYDMLTGLPNRSLLRDRLAAAGQERGASVALLFIDLGRTKEINDTLGYAAGDALLVEVGRRLLAAAGPENLAARLSGDEFVVLLRQCDKGTVADCGERIRRALAAPFVIGTQSVEITPSIRMVVVNETDERGLLGAADAAMSEAKVTIEATRRTDAQRQKLEALGRMMGGVAHEINNMLQPVALLAQVMLKQGLVIGEGTHHLGVIVDCARTARQIIGDLLAFSRPTARTTELLDPIALLSDTLRLVHQAVPPGITIATHVSGRPPSVRINRSTFAQILLNLATNAAAAMAGQGVLRIALDEHQDGSGAVVAGSPAAFVKLRVSDHGCGMDKATLDRAFEPFFSTKAIGEGTGLGLPVVYGLVQEMGGTIALDSDPGCGTTVTIMIPGNTGEA